MSYKYAPPPDLWELLAALAISLVSGAISITRRILMGADSTWLFVISEFLTAVLCGYLMYNAYPIAAPYLPGWVTLPVAVAFVAHSGGRIFQELETTIIQYYKNLIHKAPDK